jgi:deazaflavin-dependent oxidoreductase (nitroreductase family)
MQPGDEAQQQAAVAQAVQLSQRLGQQVRVAAERHEVGAEVHARRAAREDRERDQRVQRARDRQIRQPDAVEAGGLDHRPELPQPPCGQPGVGRDGEADLHLRLSFDSLMSTSRNDMNAQVIEEFRANAGRVGGPFQGMDLVLMHHTGAKSGRSFVSPAAYLQDAGRYVVFASKAGAPDNPAWYHNLMAHPQITIEVGSETRDAVASEVTGDERDRLYQTMAQRRPQFAEYERTAVPRVIPVVALTPAS